MEKFDKIKEEMNNNGKKFEAYQHDIETKKLNIQCLETEIQNIQLNTLKQQKMQLEIDEDQKKMNQQVEMLRNLKKALCEQMQGLQGFDKENQASNAL